MIHCGCFSCAMRYRNKHLSLSLSILTRHDVFAGKHWEICNVFATGTGRRNSLFKVRRVLENFRPLQRTRRPTHSKWSMRESWRERPHNGDGHVGKYDIAKKGRLAGCLWLASVASFSALYEEVFRHFVAKIGAPCFGFAAAVPRFSGPLYYRYRPGRAVNFEGLKSFPPARADHFSDGLRW